MSLESDLRRLEKARAISPAASPATVALRKMNIMEVANEVLRFPLYPMQALVLKLVTLAAELLTTWDYATLERLGQGFRVVDDGRTVSYAGTRGTTPDTLQRLESCRKRDFWAFRQVVLVLGRRASKSTMGAIVCLWQMWNLLALINPQEVLGLPARKRIMIGVFSTTASNASRDQFGDIAALLQESAAFAPFLQSVTSSRIRLYTPAQLAAGARGRKEAGLLEIRAVSTTASSARGPALVALILDEFAHLTGAGSTSDAAGIARSATPAVAQFRKEGFVFMASSPASMTGRFYDSYLEACAIDPATGEAANNDVFVLQLRSWDMYTDWEVAHELEQWPGGPLFAPITRPVLLETDPEVVNAKLRDPWSYMCEYEAQWAGSVDAYFTPVMIDGIFARFRGEVLENQKALTAGFRYAMHIDPSSVGDNTALVVGHRETIDGVDHIVIDLTRSWAPADFGGTIDYFEIAREVGVLIHLFNPDSVTIDQHSGHPLKQMIDREVTPRNDRSTLAQHVGRVRVVHASSAEKLARYEATKLLANEGCLHAPYDQILRDELTVLERRGNTIAAPRSGSIRTDDKADALAHVVARLTDGGVEVGPRFSAASVRGLPSDPGSPVAKAFTDFTLERRRARRRERGW